MTDNNTLIIVACVAAIPPTLAAVIGLFISLRNSNKIDSVHKTVNGKLGLLLSNSKDAGKQEEREDEAERKEAVK